MLHPHTVRRLLLTVAAVMAASLASAQPTYKTLPAFGLQFEREYQQTTAAGSRLGNPAAIFYAFLLPNTPGSVRLPSGTTSTIPINGQIEQRFPTFAAFDAAYPAGTYTLTAGSVTGISLVVPANPFPIDVPQVVGGTWNAAGQLVINPARDTTITIGGFAAYGKVGLDTNMSVGINTNNGDSVLSRDQNSSEVPEAFNTFTIPAGTLVAGRSYFASISFGILQALNTTAVPGSAALVFANNYLEIQLAVVAPANGAPTIATQPASKTVASGSTVVFSVEASGTPTPTYQWRLGTTPLTTAASRNPTYVFSGTVANAGNYNCVVTNSAGAVTSTDAVLTVNSVAATAVGRLVNLSVLAPTGPGSQLLTMGATVGGQGATGPASLVIRGIGPTLGSFGVGGTLADPVLSIFPAGSTTPSATNDNWGGTPALVTAFANVGAFALPPASLDSAALLTPASGGFTVQVAGKGTATGTVIAEVYDAAGTARSATTPRLTNLSTLTSIAQANTLAAGFVIGGSTARTVLVRAVGPTLGTAFSISGAMEDPKLELFNNDTGAKIAENDNWRGEFWLNTTQAAVGAFALGGAATKDAALVITLAPGPYSARVSGVNGGAGTAIIEVYEVP